MQRRPAVSADWLAVLRAPAIALLVAACVPTGLPFSPASPVADEADDGSFRLKIRADSARYRQDQPIHVTATLVFLGPGDRIVAYASGSGLVGFSLEQLDGPLDMSGVSTSDCAPHELRRGQEIEFPFKKSGAYSPDDPNAGFWRTYLSDPQLRLPRGRWRIEATASLYIGECGGPEHQLRGAVTVQVE